MALSVRPALSEKDFRRLAEIITASWPETVDEEMMHRWEANRFEGQLRRRFTAQDGDEIVGYGISIHQGWEPEGRFYIWAAVEQPRRGAGIGLALYQAGLAYARENDATSLWTEVREDDAYSLRFAEAQGFRIDRHLFESRLPVQEFDEGPYAGAVDAVRRSGIRLFSLADEDTPEVRRGLYEVNRDAALDIPGFEGDFWPYDAFSRIVFSAPSFFPEGQLLAADGDRIVGISALTERPGQDYLYNEMTGVHRDYRGRGIALALKLLAVRIARERGVKYLRTNNDSKNEPILAINRKLGYQPQPGYYRLTREGVN